MRKKNNDYFGLIIKQISYSIEASNLLEAIITNYDAKCIDEYRTKIHLIEHTADEVHHDILNRLSTEFITPIDQEDILRLVQIIDDITDALDEVVLDAYMFHVEHITEKMAELSKTVNRCVKELGAAIEELKNFKKPEKLKEYIIKVNDIEVEADALYTKAIYELFNSSCEIKTLLGTKAIYEILEECCDLCEHASDIIEQVVIKNT